jgi:hypothetical protein
MRDRDEFDALAPGQPLADFQTRGARVAVDEDLCHGPHLSDCAKKKRAFAASFGPLWIGSHWRWRRKAILCLYDPWPM